MEIYKHEKYVTTTLNDDMKYVIHTWRSMAIPLSEMVECSELVAKKVREYQLHTLIANVKDAKSVILPESLDYYVNTGEKELAKSGIKRIITIMSDNLITKRTNEKWQEETDQIELYEVSSLEEAEEIIERFH